MNGRGELERVARHPHSSQQWTSRGPQPDRARHVVASSSERVHGVSFALARPRDERGERRSRRDGTGPSRNPATKLFRYCSAECADGNRARDEKWGALLHGETGTGRQRSPTTRWPSLSQAPALQTGFTLAGRRSRRQCWSVRWRERLSG